NLPPREAPLAYLKAKLQKFGGSTRQQTSTLGIEILVVIFSLRSELDRLIAAGLGILEDFSFVIANHDLLVVVIQNVTGIDRHFAAAARGVDHELRNAIAGGMTAQAFDDFNSLCD